MLDILGALLVFSLALVVLLDLLEIIEVRHRQTARMQLGRRVVGYLYGNGLALFVVERLFDFNLIIALANRQRDQTLGSRADFLRASQRGLDAAIPDQVANLVAQQRLTLVSGSAQFALISHRVKPPYKCRSSSSGLYHAQTLIRRLRAEPIPARRASARPLPGTFCPNCEPSSCPPGCAEPARPRC